MGVTTDTRRRMVASAAVLLRERGVAGTSIAKVLAHSGGPRGSVGFHFPGGKTELVTDALRLAGGAVTRALRRAAERGSGPFEAFAEICEYYKVQLAGSDFAAGCPVWAVAQEAHRDPALGPVVASVVAEWSGALTDVLVAAGHQPADAADLATLCVGSLEGAITLARVRRSTGPIDVVLARLAPLLQPPPGRSRRNGTLSGESIEGNDT